MAAPSVVRAEVVDPHERLAVRVAACVTNARSDVVVMVAACDLPWVLDEATTIVGYASWLRFLCWALVSVTPSHTTKNFLAWWSWMMMRFDTRASYCTAVESRLVLQRSRVSRVRRQSRPRNIITRSSWGSTLALRSPRASRNHLWPLQTHRATQTLTLDPKR